MLICNIVMVAHSLGLDFGFRLITVTMAVSRACMVAALGPCSLHHVVVPFVLLFLLCLFSYKFSSTLCACAFHLYQCPLAMRPMLRPGDASEV